MATPDFVFVGAGHNALVCAGYLDAAFGAHQYRAPLPGLYLTGAGTHPGGGIMGVAGRNASRVILDDLGR